MKVGVVYVVSLSFDLRHIVSRRTMTIWQSMEIERVEAVW